MIATEASDGVLTVFDGTTVWAWTAVRIDAAADLTETQEYADLPEAERRIKAIAAETAWLNGQWDTAHGERVELRYLTDPAERATTCALLGRVSAPTPALAVSAALALRGRLAALPRHVHASPVEDAAEVARLLTPFAPEPVAGVAEIRKRYRTGLPNRPDAGVRYYVAPQPFTASAPPWDALWQALAGHPYPVMLSIGLEPYVVPDDLGPLLHRVATQYGRLGTAGQLPDGLWSPGTQLAPDAFAVDASRVYADAARRYTGRAFRVRVALASPAPVPESLAELVGATVSPPERAREGGVLTETFTGPAHSVAWPGPGELPAAWQGLTTLEQARWGGDHCWRLPEPLAPPLRLLADLVDAREAGAAFRLPLAVNGHMAGFPVRRPGMAGETAYRADGPAITLGRQLVHDTPAGPLGIGLDDLTRHALFVGTTGSGKTNTTLAFCEQLWRDHRIPFLVIEPVNSALDDYRWLATRPGFEDLVVLTVGDEGTAPLRLNPFEVPAGVRIGTHVAGLLACFDAAFGLWDPLPALYNRALRATYARKGIVPTDIAGPAHDGNWPTLRDFITEMREQCERLDYSGEVRDNIVAASRLRAESLAEGACGSTLDVARSYPVEELLRRPVVLELAAVGDNEKEQSLVTALLLQSMTEHYKANRAGGSLSHVTVIEEAHRLLGQPLAQSGDAKEGNAQARAAQAFANTLAENRKYGEGLVIVEQVPGKLVEDAYKNTNLKVMHRLPSAADRELIGGTMRFSPDQERYAATLEPFQAFAHHDRIDRPALIRVPDVRAEAARAAGVARAPLADSSQLAARFREFADTTPSVDSALAPFADCEGCRHRCAFRSRAGTAVWPEHGAELRKRVTGYPKSPAEQTDWWRSTTEWVASVAEKVPLPQPDTNAKGNAAADAVTSANANTVTDYHACVFIHIARSAWQRKTLPWTRLYRTHAPTPPGAPS
ncbi:helicase HerA domain-containing protein [Streptomyces lutosisoli]|uniref:Helicase HerA domain-containing protein n=1 Tax=Streptomyces lutosisoli TaxID=2665721 RepID=A0ABW2VEF3_9ACTN